MNEDDFDEAQAILEALTEADWGNQVDMVTDLDSVGNGAELTLKDLKKGRMN